MPQSDYMVHQDTSGSEPVSQVKQVEFNTIASSFGGLSAYTSQLHNGIPGNTLDLPDNKSIEGLARGIEAAYHAYPEPQAGRPKCVIFLIQGGERNVFDQRHLEYQVASSETSIPVFRLAFADILAHTKVADTPKRELIYTLPRNSSKVFEVAVIYMRAGYGPGDYPDKQAWDARYHLERSAAIKCPTVLTQLAGTKKVQQLLATPQASSGPSVLGKFIDEKTDSAQELWKTFTNIYPMDNSESGLEARRKATDPELCQGYVLKPQREGGGNNIYRGAIPDFLKSIPESHYGSFILMELITPPPVTNVILRNGQLEQGGVICELGIYGTCLWDQSTGEVRHNEEAGYLLRTKGDKSEEGGVAAGYGWRWIKGEPTLNNVERGAVLAVGVLVVAQGGLALNVDEGSDKFKSAKPEKRSGSRFQEGVVDAPLGQAQQVVAASGLGDEVGDAEPAGLAVVAGARVAGDGVADELAAVGAGVQLWGVGQVADDGHAGEGARRRGAEGTGRSGGGGATEESGRHCGGYRWVLAWSCFGRGGKIGRSS
ncbi:Glutathione synthetase large chain [Paramyrothecium foliicola]|nr:Glutathione synthetase large chain [Paramyrothecium foliicola]